MIGLGVVQCFAVWSFGSTAPATVRRSNFSRDTLAPEFSETWGRGVVLYCYAQMVHYSVWFPACAANPTGQSTPRSFRESLRVLLRTRHGRFFAGDADCAVALLFALRDVWRGRFRLMPSLRLFRSCARSDCGLVSDKTAKLGGSSKLRRGFLPVVLLRHIRWFYPGSLFVRRMLTAAKEVDMKWTFAAMALGGVISLAVFGALPRVIPRPRPVSPGQVRHFLRRRNRRRGQSRRRPPTDGSQRGADQT